MRCGALITAAGIPGETEQFLPLVNVGGISVVKRQIAAFRQVGIESIVVVTGYHAAMLERHLAHSKVTCIRNHGYAATKMFDSIRIGMESILDLDAVMITPADVPYMHADTLRALLSAPTPIAVPQHGRRTGHPVMVRSELFETLLHYDGSDGLRGFIRANEPRITRVLIDDGGVLLSIGREETLKAVQAQQLPAVPKDAEVTVSLRVGEYLFGKKLVMLLHAIGRTGSLQAASAESGVSYSSAWTMLGEAEKALQVPLLIRKLGGVSGGGSELTPQARSLLHAYERIQVELERTAARLLRQEFRE